ncbi:DNA adenine methylase [Cupriavidus sp. WGlv3]|uniref:DNA adenine methylase n=1 Tax=Cupriavidus sp. WGlv3 TaxID=2919924 RepID=UPI00209178C6|nr:DNA adenine methylase [Cupriavidus sp. WGlv3]MCO4862854.1 DNA adenine methylase [Cupriavidus sp. WGlv3]
MNSERIKTLRLGLGLSQTKLAQVLGIAPGTVNKWEAGKTKISAKFVAALDKLEVAARRDAQVFPSANREVFRPIQYLGSKARLVSTVRTLIQGMASAGETVGDLFCGSGVVSHFLSGEHPIIAVDIQGYSEVLGVALLSGKQEHFENADSESFWNRYSELTSYLAAIYSPLLRYEEQALSAAKEGNYSALTAIVESGSLAANAQCPLHNRPRELVMAMEATLANVSTSNLLASSTTATNYFGGPYFSYWQTIGLDALYMTIAEQPRDIGASLKGVLLSVASEIVNTVGKQFAQPIKLIKADGGIQPLLLQRTLRDRNLNVEEVFRAWAKKWGNNSNPNDFSHQVIRGDVLSYLENPVDCKVYYADPPYTIDHYSRFYHVLETLVHRDEPSLDETVRLGQRRVMRGIYRAGRYQSPFCIPSAAAQAYASMFSRLAKKEASLLLSYSHFEEDEGHRPRLMSMVDLVNLAGKYFSHVELYEPDNHIHRKLNAASLNASSLENAEKFLICTH